MGSIEKKLSYLFGTKNAIKEAIASKGVNITDDHTFRDYADKIMEIRGKEYYVPSLSANDVNFYDYDGGILHTYTKDEFLALSEMPSLPERLGLVCQGWNYSLEDAKAYVGEYGVLHIGAMYITDDGKTRLYITIDSPFAAEVPLYFSLTTPNSLVIDWGDGKKEPISGSGSLNVSHKYEEVGDYVIAFEVAEGCVFTLGQKETSSSYIPLMGSTSVYSNMLKKVEIGKNITEILQRTFCNCYSLLSVTIPKYVTTLDNHAFYYCLSLSSITIPDSVTSIGNYAFDYCYSLTSITIPDSVTSIGNSAFGHCSSLTSILIPNNITTLESMVFSNCSSLQSVILNSNITFRNGSQEQFINCTALRSFVFPEQVSYLGPRVFNDCKSLTSVIFNRNELNLNSVVLSNCISLVFLDFSRVQNVPSLAGSTYIPSSNYYKIIVPDALYDEWIAATNWSTHASKIIKKSDWDASQA